MKINKEYGLNTITDLKIFLLFLLDSIRRPIEEQTLVDIAAENTDDISFDYDECLRELCESGHLYFDEVDGVRYYMASEKGRAVASELHESLDKGFREKSLRSARKHISLLDSGTRVEADVASTKDNRYSVTMRAIDRFGEIMSVSLTVSSRDEADKIKQNFLEKPDSVYRGILFSVSGEIEYLA